MQEWFLTPDLAAKVAAKVVGGPGFAGVFTRAGCPQLMRHLLLYGDRSIKAEALNDKDLGALMLLAKAFFQFDQNLAQPATLDLLLSFLPVWDIHNPRELAYAVSHRRSSTELASLEGLAILGDTIMARSCMN